MLTQVTRFASVMAVELRGASMDVRASFPTAEKYGVGDGGSAMESLAYTIDLTTDADRDQVVALIRRAERACHAANSLRGPVSGSLRVNGEDVAM